MSLRALAGLLACVSLVATPVLAQANTIVFTNYGQYGAAPPPGWDEKVTPLVEDVVKSIKRGGSATIHLDGHADFDAAGEAYCVEISRKRASAAQQTLMAKLIQRAALEGLPPQALLDHLATTMTPWGTSKALVPADRPLTERQRNRRVEITWTSTYASPRPRPRGPAIPTTTLQMVGYGIWNGDARQAFGGEGQLILIMNNTNILPATLEITWNIGGNASERKTVSIAPGGTQEVAFAILESSPRTWNIQVRQISQAMLVAWSAWSHVR
ncbi:MAG: hypothetical protein ACK5V0_00300 [Alphaproteobacteria bacterium]